MPYNNLPKSKWPKMDRCVTRVMAGDPSLSKDRAIAICFRSISKESETEDPIVEVIEDTLKEALPSSGKCDSPSLYVPFGGATSFEELDAYWTAQHQASFISSTTYDFRSLVNNILQDDSISDKGKAISNLADEYQKRISHPPAEKGLLGRVFDSIKSLIKKDPEILPSSFLLYKDSQGADRWFGWVSNKWRDRDTYANPLKGGEILTSDSHKEYVSLLDENPSLAPELWSWHTPGTARKSPADWWDYADGFLMMSGPLTPEEASALKEVQKSGVQLGMSHGFFALTRDESQGLIKAYYSFEVSDLPVRFAANPWTGLQTISQEVKEMGFSSDKRKYLVTLLGEEQVKKLEDSTKEMAQNLEALNIDSKEASTQEPTPPVVDTKVLAEEISKSLDLPSVVKAAVAPVVESVSSLDTQLKEVVGRIEKLEKSDDEKLAALISPAASPASVSSTAASKSQDTVVKDDDPLVTQKTTTSWVTEAFRPSAPAAS